MPNPFWHKSQIKHWLKLVAEGKLWFDFDPSTNRMTMNLFLTDFSYIDFNKCKKYDSDFCL